MEVLWLTEEEVRSLLTIDDAIAAVQRAFLDHGNGRTQMPPKSYLYLPKHNGDLRCMPAYLEGQDLVGVKIVNVHPGNPQIGLPSVMALLILNSPRPASLWLLWAQHISPACAPALQVPSLPGIWPGRILV